MGLSEFHTSVLYGLLNFPFLSFLPFLGWRHRRREGQDPGQGGYSSRSAASHLLARQLVDGRTLHDYNIQIESDIYIPCLRGWAAVTWKCHSALQAWTPGVTWSVTWCYLECYLVLPGRCLALPGFLFWSRFFFVVPKYPRSSNSNFWKKINFHLEMLPGPTPVVVTCLPGPPSGWAAEATWRRTPVVRCGTNAPVEKNSNFPRHETPPAGKEVIHWSLRVSISDPTFNDGMAAQPSAQPLRSKRCWESKKDKVKQI